MLTSSVTSGIPNNCSGLRLHSKLKRTGKKRRSERRNARSRKRSARSKKKRRRKRKRRSRCERRCIPRPHGPSFFLLFKGMAWVPDWHLPGAGASFGGFPFAALHDCIPHFETSIDTQIMSKVFWLRDYFSGGSRIESLHIL